MAERDFIIQRYAYGNWPYVRGHAPFIARGANFDRWVIPGSLEKHRQYHFRRELRMTLMELFPSEGAYRELYYQDAIGEFLLRDQIVTALWSVSSRECLPSSCWSDESIREVARQIHYAPGVDIAESTIELLCAMNSAGHYESYLADDGMKLEAAVIV